MATLETEAADAERQAQATEALIRKLHRRRSWRSQQAQGARPGELTSSG